MLLAEHREAIEYDLLTRTGHEVADVGDSLSWGALKSFIRGLDLESRTVRAVKPEEAKWGTRVKTNMILADIYDVLAMINANLVAVGGRKRAKKPKSYPRPNDSSVKKYGKKAVPVKDLRAFFINKNRRRGHGGSYD